MASPSLRVDLLHELCGLLPEHDATLIGRMPTDDLMTYVEAYAAARRCGVDVPSDLRRAYVASLVDEIESEFSDERRIAAV